MKKGIWAEIEEARAKWNVLEHPFYQRWSAGELTSEDLAHYAGQYRHATQALATLSADAAESAPADEKAGLRRHAAEEEAHVGLWDGFLNEVGGDAGAAPTPETSECVAQWTGEGDFASQLVRLYAIESGQPDISRTKREGLAEHYGVGDGDGNAYFRVHERADVEHAAAARQLIERHCDPGDHPAMVATAEATFAANWRLLDGV